jgi:ABC transport system ATP-binding/permease protein
VKPRVRAKLSYTESRELAVLPDRIAVLEAEQQLISAQLANNETYRTRAAEVGALQLRHAAIEEELATLLQRWEELEAKQSL